MECCSNYLDRTIVVDSIVRVRQCVLMLPICFNVSTVPACFFELSTECYMLH